MTDITAPLFELCRQKIAVFAASKDLYKPFSPIFQDTGLPVIVITRDDVAKHYPERVCFSEGAITLLEYMPNQYWLWRAIELMINWRVEANLCTHWSVKRAVQSMRSNFGGSLQLEKNIAQLSSVESCRWQACGAILFDDIRSQRVRNPIFHKPGCPKLGFLSDCSSV